MAKTDLTGIVAKLQAAESFLVCTHASPDGDAIGSMLATWHLLHAMGKDKVTCACEDPVPQIYRWLPGAEQVVDASGPLPSFDIAVLVDVSKRDRLGRVDQLIGAHPEIIVIDHHLDDSPCGHFQFVDPSYAAVGEIIAALFEQAGLPLSREAAVCIYVALATDTGSFRFANTTPRSHRVAAALLDTGISVGEIAARIFDEMSFAKFKLLIRLLDHARLSTQGRLAHSEITKKDLDETGATEEDLDGLINFVRNIEGVDVAILFREVDPDTTKVSFRSRKPFNSAAFLQRFGGGGHAGAAGATVEAPLEEVRETILREVRAALGKPQ